MRAATASLLLFILCATVGVSALAQTTSGTSATIVVPLLAQTGSFASEVSVYNPNGTAIQGEVEEAVLDLITGSAHRTTPGLDRVEAIEKAIG